MFIEKTIRSAKNFREMKDSKKLTLKRRIEDKFEEISHLQRQIYGGGEMERKDKTMKEPANIQITVIPGQETRVSSRHKMVQEAIQKISLS